MDNPANGHVRNTATMTMHAAPPERDNPAPARPPLAEADVNADACRCGHRLEQHDAIATRYCLATTTGHMDRGCICAGTAVAQA